MTPTRRNPRGEGGQMRRRVACRENCLASPGPGGSGDAVTPTVACPWSCLMSSSFWRRRSPIWLSNSFTSFTKSGSLSSGCKSYGGPWDMPTRVRRWSRVSSSTRRSNDLDGHRGKRRASHWDESSPRSVAVAHPILGQTFALFTEVAGSSSCLEGYRRL